MSIGCLIASLGTILFILPEQTSAGHWFTWQEKPHFYHDSHVCNDEAHEHHLTETKPDDEPTSFHGIHICSCLLLVDDMEVFRREDSHGWYSCSGYGLYRCEKFCTNLFQGELENHSRQNACDVLGREIYTSWYQRSQVCGPAGPFEINPLPTGLCCRRGRPSEECSEESQL